MERLKNIARTGRLNCDLLANMSNKTMSEFTTGKAFDDNNESELLAEIENQTLRNSISPIGYVTAEQVKNDINLKIKNLEEKGHTNEEITAIVEAEIGNSFISDLQNLPSEYKLTTKTATHLCLTGIELVLNQIVEFKDRNLSEEYLQTQRKWAIEYIDNFIKN